MMKKIFDDIRKEIDIHSDEACFMPDDTMVVSENRLKQILDEAEAKWKADMRKHDIEAKAIVQEVAKDGGWIPCSERLPPTKENPDAYSNPTISEDVFAICSSHGFLIPAVAYYVHDKKQWEDSDNGRRINVVKWMPLPPYQKGE